MVLSLPRLTHSASPQRAHPKTKTLPDGCSSLPTWSLVPGHYCSSCVIKKGVAEENGSRMENADLFLPVSPMSSRSRLPATSALPAASSALSLLSFLLCLSKLAWPASLVCLSDCLSPSWAGPQQACRGQRCSGQAGQAGWPWEGGGREK